MSVEIWPPISPTQLKIEEDATQAREQTWLLATLSSTLQSLKHGLEEAYALLAPIDPGSTLVLSTHRNETVKGHITRVGTRIAKGTVHLRLRTLPPQTLTLDPSCPIHLPALEALNTLLTESVDLVALCATETQPTAAFLSSQLRLLAQHLSEALALIKGPHPSPSPSPSTSLPVTPQPRPGSSGAGLQRRPGTSHSIRHENPHNSITASPQSLPPSPLHPAAPSDPNWTTSSIPLSHFAPPLSRNLSFYLTIQDASLVLYLRALEPADAPVNFGTKLAFAIGTARRLEHDEADRVFGYVCEREGGGGDGALPESPAVIGGASVASSPGASISSNSRKNARTDTSSSTSSPSRNKEKDNKENKGKKVEVYVREKVRVESADPSLLSMSAKLIALSNTLSLARRNLAAVMGEEEEEEVDDRLLEDY
ncbi:37S ribosomal protein rsm22 [Xylariomycetidae sp. FL2044]|nr:37S ribosomal protein rsm22 [Xylariomycetidae sp. FL2044]